MSLIKYVGPHRPGVTVNDSITGTDVYCPFNTTVLVSDAFEAQLIATQPTLWADGGDGTAAYSPSPSTRLLPVFQRVAATDASTQFTIDVQAGSAGQAVGIDGLPVSAGGGGGNGLPATVQSKTANYTAAAGEFVLADATTAGFTVTLPTAPTTGALVAVKKTDGTVNIVTVAPGGGGTIDGDANATITSKNFGAVLEHTGSNVWKIAAVTASGGSNGVDGKTLRNGTVDPTGGVGTDGDFYLNTTANTIFGPKASGAWGSGTSIKGAAGAIAQVQDEGSNVAVRGTLNFVGGGVTATDDAANSRTNVTIPSASIVPRGRAVEAGTIQYIVPGFHVYSHSGQTMTAGRIVYQPLLAATDITIDQLAIRVNALVAASSARAAIYTADTAWQPVALVIEPTSSTQFDTSTTGTKTTTAFTQALTAGRYLIALQCSAGIQVDSPFCATDVGGYDMVNGPISSWFVASTYGALPSTPVAWTSHNAGNTGFMCPVLSRVSVA